MLKRDGYTKNRINKNEELVTQGGSFLDHANAVRQEYKSVEIHNQICLQMKCLIYER